MDPILDPVQQKALFDALALTAKDPMHRLGQIIDTRMSLWHFQNALDVALKARNLLEQRGISADQLDPKLREIVPIIEAVKNEDDKTLQELWAGLLASALDSQSEPQVFQYNEVLKLLSPLEAAVLNNLAWSAIEGNERMRLNHYVGSTVAYNQAEALAERMSVSHEGVALAFEHLENLGLVRTPGNFRTDLSRAMKGVELSPMHVWFTDLGKEFMTRCTGDSKFLDDIDVNGVRRDSNR